MKYKQKKYTILTYIIGDYEKLHEIENKCDNIEYVCVTDNKHLRSKTWCVKYIDDDKTNDVWGKCYEIRFNPFKYSNTDIILRIDGSIGIKDSNEIIKIFEEFDSGGYDMGLMIHPHRNTQIDEYETWIKCRDYPLKNAYKCLKYIENLGAINLLGMYQMCFQIQRNNSINNTINNHTLQVLRELGTDRNTERLDQTVFSAILNVKYKDELKILPFTEDIITNSKLFQWYGHNSDVKIPVKTDTIKPYLFNKPLPQNSIYTSENEFYESMTKQMRHPKINSKNTVTISINNENRIKWDGTEDMYEIFGDKYSELYWQWKNRDDWKTKEYVSIGDLKLSKKEKDCMTSGTTVTLKPSQTEQMNGVQYSFDHNVDEYKRMMSVFAESDVPALKGATFSKFRYDTDVFIMHKSDFFDYCAFIFGYIKKYQHNFNINTFGEIKDRVDKTIGSYQNGKSVEENSKELIPSLLDELAQIWVNRKKLNGELKEI